MTTRPCGIAFNAVQRECLELDPVRWPTHSAKNCDATYKSDALLRERHGRKRDARRRNRYDVEGYLDHQSTLFETRMDAATYRG